MKSLLLLVPLLLSCSQKQPSCSADESGFGSAPAVKLTPISTTAPPAGSACRARFDVLRTQSELASAYTELGLTDPPAIDFVNEVVIVRVAEQPATFAWAVQDKAGIVIGLQSCQEPSEVPCSPSFYRAPGPITGVDTRTCDPVHCGFTSGS